MTEAPKSSHKNKPFVASPSKRITLQGMLALVALLSSYLAIIAAMLRNPEAMLQPGDGGEIFALCCLGAILFGFGCLLYDVMRSPNSRSTSLLLIVGGFLYVVANAGIFVATMMIDSFVIFNEFYIYPLGIGLPALLAISVGIAAFFIPKFSTLSLVGISLILTCTGFVHLFVVSACAASV